MTEKQFEVGFPLGDSAACCAYLKASPWPEGVRCPRCGNPAVYDLPDKVSLLTTDDWVGYQDYLRKYPQQSVDHSKHQYVVGTIHTNAIEGFWSIFKRGVVGTFHKVSAQYLPLYAAEFPVPI